MKQPRLPDPGAVSTTDIARRFMTFASEVAHSLAAQPSCELLAVDVDGNFPLSVLTTLRALNVHRGQTYERDNPASTIEDTSIAWRLSDDAREPGIVIDSMGGLTIGTVYTVRLTVFGEEVR